MTLPSPVPREAAWFQGASAGVVSRFVAAALDFLVVVLVLTGGYLVWATVLFLAGPRHFRLPAAGPFTSLLAGGVTLTGYLALGWTLTGRTYGKRVMGLRLVDRDGRRPRSPRAVLRAVLCVAAPIGLLWVAVSPRRRSLQDILLRTSVVYDWSRPGKLPEPPASDGDGPAGARSPARPGR